MSYSAGPPESPMDRHDDPHGAPFAPFGHGEDKPDTTRACDACRKHKIRCIGKENPPCRRCKNMKLECKFAPIVFRTRLPSESATALGTNSRLDALESEVSKMSTKLDDLSTLLLRLPALQYPTPSPNNTMGGHSQIYDSRRQSGPSPSASVGDTHRSNLHEWNGRLASGAHWSGSTPSVISQPHDHGSGSGPVHLPPIRARTPTENDLAQAMERSASGSEDDDPLESAARLESFRSLTNLEEESRLRAQRGLDPNSHLRAGSASSHRVSSLRATKRRRTESRASGRDADDESGWSTSLPIHEKGDRLKHGADPVELGFMSEAEGRELFHAFFEYSHPFLPILDPEVDTWEDLRRRSPFLVTVMVMIAARARDCSGVPSELTKRCEEEAEAMAKFTLFSPISTLETVQAMTFLASWGDNGWRAGCHAMTLAVDMGIFRCLPMLQKIRRNRRGDKDDIQRQRPLVVGARLWLGLVKISFELSLNYHLPLQFPAPSHIRYDLARELLAHPLSNLFDARLVVSYEMLQARESLIRPYDQDEHPTPAELDNQIRAVNEETHARYQYWGDYYRRRGIPEDHFLVNELSRARAFASIYVNSAALYGVHDQTDVSKLSVERRQWLSSALRAAAFLISGSLSKGSHETYSKHLYGNHFYYVGIVAMSRYLIRMTSLMPEVCDLHQVSLDIDRLLLQLPEFAFTEMLRRTLLRARQQGALPYTHLSRPSKDEQAISSGGNDHAVPSRRPPPPVHSATNESPVAPIPPGNATDLQTWFPATTDTAAVMELDSMFHPDVDFSSWLANWSWLPTNV